MQHTSPPVKKVTAKKPRRLKWILLITVLIIASPFLIHYGTTELHRWQMRSYLENKYNQEFIVERPERKGSGLGVEGHLDAIAYPKDDSAIRFIIVSSSSGVVDGYVEAVWSNEEINRLRGDISSIFGEKTNYDIKIKPSMSLKARNIDIGGSVPSFSSAANRYGKQISYDIIISKIEGKLLVDRDKRLIIEKLLMLKNKLPAKTDTVITYKSADYGSKKYGLIITLEKLKALPKESIVNMFKEWKEVSI